MANQKYILALTVAGLLACCTQKKIATNPLKTVLASQNPKIKRVMDSVSQYDVQIRYTQIDRKNDSIYFTDYDFQVDSSNYFYPASTVKLPTVVLALERLNASDFLNMNTNFYVEGDSVETTFAVEISKIFLFSDNEANNRLFEFLGQDRINNGLEDKGIHPVRISHRLSTPDAGNITTKPLIVYLNDSTTTILAPTINSPIKRLNLRRIIKGRGYYKDDILIHKPFNFSLKNYYPITAQHAVLKRIIFPQNFLAKERFHLSQVQREYLLSAMSSLPRTSGYDAEKYPDGYGKLFMYGDTNDQIPDNIKIYNKLGGAYGTLTDCAYITDTKNQVEFMLTATITVNKNGIFNDDDYEYDEIGIPFLAALGRELYAAELERKREQG
ncbi:class A beta-lactamase-related serine hydrolase [Flavobacteriaceae bacterium F89]|uniref:Class A beta-lactamase-related serine hydrolase n=1 Tax=Cerina litoralis TaxID=2874477 RepID=A0AAE3JRG5_9FLAO|nr:serine hydrolase [Cerina litoralis]MCG2459617.1 class A beta-lactamase-related serine hydrolase [Cerina litoralis]